MERILKMSLKEIDRLYEVKKVIEEGIGTIKEMSKKLGISYRQGRRIAKRYKEEGEAGLCHRNRGKPSNRRLPEEVRKLVEDFVKDGEKGDWGPTLIAEKIEEIHQRKVDHETVRRILIEKGLYRRRRKRRIRHRLRERKEHFGELIQMDGSFHRWFKGIEEKQCLMVMIDDATSERIAMLGEGETTKSAMELLKRWIERYGIPKALYTDWKNVYLQDIKTAERLKAKGQETLTQFGKVCAKLGIEIIGASSPQAKGRIERANGVFQDRLIKELDFRGIKTIEKANEFLEREYLELLNSKFSRIPASEIDYHRRKLAKEEIDEIFVTEEERTVGNDWTIRFRGKIYQIESCNKNIPPTRSKIKVIEKLDGSLHFIYREWEMEVKDVTHIERPKRKEEKKVTNKRAKKRYKPSPEHPWRKFSFGDTQGRASL